MHLKLLKTNFANNFFFSYFFQKVLPALVTYVRYSTGETDLKAVLSKKIPKEQERVKNFRKQHGATKVGEVTVDMVSKIQFNYKQ